MRWRFTLVVLAALLLFAATTTFLSLKRTPTDTIEVELGIRPATSETIRALELAAIDAFERHQFSAELKNRLAKPPRSIELSPFLADRCEVSQLQWEQFVEWRTSQPGFSDVNSDWLVSSSSKHRIAGRLTSPASGINYRGASEYCTAAGGRLPFAEEFEAMASGFEGRLYPWGDEFQTDAWPFNSAERNSSQECGAHPYTSTPNEIHDLGTNAMEWGQGPMFSESREFTPSIHGAPAARRTNRALYALNAAWLEGNPELKSNYLGFRCVYGRHPLILPWRTQLQDVVNMQEGVYPIGLPSDARMPLFLASMPDIREISLRPLLRDDEENSPRLLVDRCEVKRSSFQRFLTDPLVRLGMYSNENEPAEIDYRPLYWDEQLATADLPVYGVNWWAADAYARWAGGRLPTVDEWRQLAAGEEGYSYVWGMGYDKHAANTGDDSEAELKSCDTTNRDRIAAGVADLGGNLSEWTRSLGLQSTPVTIWVQGGNWLLPGRETAQSIFGRAVPLTHRSRSIGFRVVYD